MGFYEKYIETVTKNDLRTRNSVDAIIGRMDELLEDRPDGRLSGLVVGRVQSGKTRNYVGLALKAAEAGWNVIITLTSCNTALAAQTEKRMKRDFAKSGVGKRHAFRLNLLENVYNEDASELAGPGYFYWGVAMKEKRSLERIVEWLDHKDNKKYVPLMKVLVIDDEADNASQNSNAGTDDEGKRLAKAEKTVEDVANAIRECKEEPFDALADWVERLVDMEMPDDAADTPEAEALRGIKDILNGKNPENAVLGAVLDNVAVRQILGLDQPVDEEEGEYGEKLDKMARRYFNGKSGARSAKCFAKLLQAVFQIVKDRSTINKKILSIIDRADEKSSDYTFPFAKCAYIAYTATPYSCILNERPDQTKMYPDFIYSLEKSPKYFGLDEIFGRDVDSAIPNMDIVRSITEKEEDAVVRRLQGLKPKKDGTKQLKKVEDDLTCITDRFQPFVWESLKEAVAWAFCCAAARRWRRIKKIVPKIMRDNDLSDDERQEKLQDTADRWTTMLFNISQKQSVHDKTQEILEEHVKWWRKDDESRAAFSEYCKALWERETARFDVGQFEEQVDGGRVGDDKYENDGKISPAPSWDEISEDFNYFLKDDGANYDVLVINCKVSENQEYYTQSSVNKKGKIDGDHLWFICGGNTIGRGLTLEGLVSSYFDRVKTKSVAVDTMTQMGRWFGYRIGYELLPRVWMTPYCVKAFKETAVIEYEMHKSMAENFANKASPRDEAAYQQVYCCGRRLSGRDHAKRMHDTGVGTYASTKEISVAREDLEKIVERTRRFFSDIADHVSTDRVCEEDGVADCGDAPKIPHMYAKVPLWRGVACGTIKDYVRDVIVNSPDESRKILHGLLREVENDKSGRSGLWDVVLAEPQYDAYKSTKIPSYNIGACREASVGTPPATSCANGIARYGSPFVHIPYYANIPTKYLTAVDYENFRALHNNATGSVIAQAITTKMGTDKWPSFSEKLAPYLGDDIDTDNVKERIDAFLEQYDPLPREGEEGQDVPDRGPMPDVMRSFLNDRSNEYRNRSSSRYMETVHKRAGEMRPMLQIYLIEPPAEADAGDVPLVAVSVYWPGHAPDKFYAMTTSLKAPVPPPNRKAFYDAVEAVLHEWGFPMATKRLRNTVMDRLGPGCTKDFFDKHIAKIPEGRQYEAVAGHDAYMPARWDSAMPVDTRLALALVKAAIDFIRKDNKKHESKEVFAKILEDPKLGDFFGPGNPNDFAYFNSLFGANEHVFFDKLPSEDILAGNGIKVVKRRPITWQYQG